MKVMHNQRVPMPDGVELAADVYLPDGPGRHPIILSRTCYHRIGLEAVAHLYIQRGYGFVAQDVRGRWASQGRFTPYTQEAADGQVTIDWIANQRWCDGHIAMRGESYLAMLQIPAAAGGHEALKAIAPGIGSASFFEEWLRYDGCPAWANLLYWGLIQSTTPTLATDGHIDWHELFKIQNLQQVQQAFGSRSSFIEETVRHDHADAFFEQIDSRRLYPRVKCPAINIGGWFDHVSRGQIVNHRGLRDAAATDHARQNQSLIMGPWGHMNIHLNNKHDQTRYGQWSFGQASAFDTRGQEMQFFDRHLRHIDTPDTPPVQLFVMGRNQWRTFDRWPGDTEQCNPQTWHLAREGDARTLSPNAPSQNSDASYVYDPANPCPTLGGPIFWWFDHHGPVDQQAILQRDDVLSYRSAPLPQALCIAGDAALELSLAADVPDTDIIAKLCVEKDDGTVVVITHGSLRLRYRESFAKPVMLTPGQATTANLRFEATAYEFSPGQRLHLIITSSDYPRILPHTNTDATLAQQLEGRVTPQKARVTLHHSQSQGCKLLLPVLTQD